MSTTMPKAGQITRKWYILDAAANRWVVQPLLPL